MKDFRVQIEMLVCLTIKAETEAGALDIAKRAGLELDGSDTFEDGASWRDAVLWSRDEPNAEILDEAAEGSL